MGKASPFPFSFFLSVRAKEERKQKCDITLRLKPKKKKASNTFIPGLMIQYDHMLQGHSSTTNPQHPTYQNGSRYSMPDGISPDI